MNKQELKELLFSKDTKEVYNKVKEIESITNTSDQTYFYFDLYMEAIHSSNSNARGRGFRMIMRNARWDKKNKIEENLDAILKVLDDDNAPVVRQCMKVLSLLGNYKCHLIPKIEKKLANLDLSKYKESMQSLIKRDIEKSLKSMNE